jgi:hypothetical protein
MAAFETFSFLNKDYEAEDKLIGTLAELNIYLDSERNEFF